VLAIRRSKILRTQTVLCNKESTRGLDFPPVYQLLDEESARGMVIPPIYQVLDEESARGMVIRQEITGSCLDADSDQHDQNE
jgi:hypothetical protein